MILPFSNTTINTLKENDRYLMLKNNILVSVQHIVQNKSQNSCANLIVKQFLNPSEFTSVPLLSFKVGLYIVNTIHVSELFCISSTEIKYKCFFIRLSKNSAVL